MGCQNCNSERIVSLYGNCSEGFSVTLGDAESEEVPSDLGIGGSEYLEFDYCLNCGQVQGDFPLPPTTLEEEEDDDDEDEDEWNEPAYDDE